MIKCVIMAGVGTEEKALYSLKKISHHLLLKSNYLYPTKGKKKARLNDTIGDYSMGGGGLFAGAYLRMYGMTINTSNRKLSNHSILFNLDIKFNPSF